MTPSVLGTNGLGLNGAGTGGNGNGVTITTTGFGFNRSNIDSANPMDRDHGAAFAPEGYFARHGESRHRNNGFNFSINPLALAANAQKHSTTSLSPRGSSPGSIDGPANWTGGLDTGNKSRHDTENEAADSLNLNRSGSKDGAYRPQSRWVTSLSGRYVEFDDDQKNANRDGSLWYVTSALGYRFTGATATARVRIPLN